MFNLKTNKPQFFLQNTSCTRKPQVISGKGGGGGGGGATLHPLLPRYAPGEIYEIYDHFRIQKLELS